MNSDLANKWMSRGANVGVVIGLVSQVSLDTSQSDTVGSRGPIACLVSVGVAFRKYECAVNDTDESAADIQRCTWC